MKKLLWILFLALGSIVTAQNFKARVANTLPATDPYIQDNGPTNWAVEWVDIGTNTSASAPYIFIGNQAARDAFISARVIPWSNWNANTAGEFKVFLGRSNDLFQISNNLSTLRNLYQSNVDFVFTVATNRPAVTFTNGNLIISNQIVTLSRLFNQLAPALKLLYKGD